MPNLTFAVAPDRPPVIDLVVTVTEELAELLQAEGRPVPLPVIAPALLDTGARESLISQDIADELGLPQRGAREVLGIGGNVSVPGHVRMVRLFYGGVPTNLLTHSAPVVAVPNLDHLGARMILGRDLLRMCVVIYNGPAGSCTFAF